MFGKLSVKTRSVRVVVVKVFRVRGLLALLSSARLMQVGCSSGWVGRDSRWTADSEIRLISDPVSTNLRKLLSPQHRMTKIPGTFTYSSACAKRSSLSIAAKAAT